MGASPGRPKTHQPPRGAAQKRSGKRGGSQYVQDTVVRSSSRGFPVLEIMAGSHSDPP
jgi:hypothetical protein